MPLDPAHVVLSKARDDERLAALVVNQAAVSDEQLGFLAQQAVEKGLKAVLCFHRVSYRRTHDLSELPDLLKASAIVFPSSLQACSGLTPFATELRYDYLPIEPDNSPFDRDGVMRLVRLALDWAEQMIGPNS